MSKCNKNNKIKDDISYLEELIKKNETEFLRLDKVLKEIQEESEKLQGLRLDKQILEKFKPNHFLNDAIEPKQAKIIRLD